MPAPAAGVLWAVTGALSALFYSVDGQQQYFRARPHDSEVIEGESKILECQVGNQAGLVQWSKDGFVLGFDRDVPGFPRYSMTGDEEDGYHNLKISNAQIEDDAEYQCQVGPTSDNRAIRSNAHLTVLLPPKTIEITDHENGSKIEIHQQESLNLKCIVPGGKPAAEIKWLRKTIELRSENIRYNVEDADGRRQDAISIISLTPSPEDNGVTYSCEAHHKALPAPLRTTVELSVLYPPGPPIIEGYQEGKILRVADTLTLSCVSRGGNPLAKLVWFKGDEQVDFSYTTTGREATNTLSIVVEPADNNAVYRCEASSRMVPEAMTTSVRITVQFAPAKVTITGPKEAKAGDTVTMVCTTDRSNPPAEISWVVDGRPMHSSNTVTADPKGGWVTSSDVTVNITGLERNRKMFSCYAVNQVLGETIVETAVLSILYPPDPPNIFGYVEGTPIRAGNLQRITCVTNGGNPLPTLKWFKGDKEITSSQTTTTGSAVTNEIAIVTKDSDNGAEYRCEASNSASQKALATAIKLSVHFPPSGVIIKIKPKRPKAGQKVTLICESASSNPKSTITWWKDSFMIPGSGDDTVDAPYGGKATRNSLILNVTTEDDGTTYTCQATNEALQQSVHDAVTLNVLYKPEFVSPTESIDVMEGESAVVTLTTRGNPSSITYTWNRNGAIITDGTSLGSGEFPYVVASGPTLNITAARKEDAGEYKCEATNEMGTTEISVMVYIKYPATVFKVTELVVVDQEANAYLECMATGYPLPDDVITWRREGFEMERTRTSVEKGRSFLTITNVSREDSGKFECVADNGVGAPDVKTAVLVVKHSPIIDNSPLYSRSASDNGDTAKIICQAEGAPDISFTWAREGAIITAETNPDKYQIEVAQQDIVVWRSVLYVKDVKSADYGGYECIARNELGFESATIKLDIPTRPDPPLSVKVLNFTHNSVLLRWSPGFDGGQEQSFRVRYKKTDSLAYMYNDVDPHNATTFTVWGLELATEYIFSVMAMNDIGESEYTKDIVKATTLREAPVTETERAMTEVLSEKGDIPRLIIISVSVVGSCLLVLNIILVICFVRKRRKKRIEEESDQSSSKAATIEMYAPSSYNETVNGETLSSTSEKSEAYSEGRSTGEYSEDQGKPAASTYLIDQGDGTYIPDGSMPQYSPYRYPEPVSAHSTLDRNHTMPNKTMYTPQENYYTDALRRNIYNQKLGEKVAYGRSEQPPPPPGRTAASGADHYNTAQDARYVPYPIVPTVLRPGTNPPMLSTFNPQSSPNPSGLPNHLLVEGVVPDEMAGHLV